MEQLPLTIRKTWFGYVVIAVLTLAPMSLVWIGLLELLDSGQVDPTVAFGLGAFLIVLIALAGIVQTYVYSLSYITLTRDGVTFKNWSTLFVSKEGEWEWMRVSRSTAKNSSIFGQLLDYGTVEIETNGGHIPAKFTWAPDPDGLQDIIQRYADQATADVSIQGIET